MRHKKGNSKLGKPTDQRLAMLRAQACALFKNNRITTTVTRAKQIRRLVDRAITLVKKNDLAAKRQILSILHDKPTAKMLWSNTTRFAKRSGGYTRIVQVGQRLGDAVPMAILELVDISA
jgi:large subunit ribosomal protein L17